MQSMNEFHEHLINVNIVPLRHDLDGLKALCDIDSKPISKTLTVMSAYIQHRFSTRGARDHLVVWTNVRLLDWYNNLEDMTGLTEIEYDVLALRLWITNIIADNGDLPAEVHRRQVARFFAVKKIMIFSFTSPDMVRLSEPKSYRGKAIAALTEYYTNFVKGIPTPSGEERALRRSRMNAIAAEEFDKAVKEISVLKEAIKELGSLVIDLPDRGDRVEKVSAIMARLGIKS